jgi:hypothetical protein
MLSAFTLEISMNGFHRSSRLALFILALLAWPARGEDAGMFPFVLPWDDDGESVTNVGFLHPKPAGASGFIRAKEGHFVDEECRRKRFLGVNFTFGANFTDKESARKVAARLHKFGVNVVRLHHMDYSPAPNGIFDPRYKDTRHLDAGQLDRLDYLVAQLKQHGIYVNINLHVSRHLYAGDGLPDTGKLTHGSKIITFFEPRFLELQKQYAHDLLTHRNPYTKTRYVEEPAVAFIELTNENTLVGMAWNGSLDNLPPSYRDELRKQWNTWLAKKYSDTETLARAWKTATTERGPELLQILGDEGVQPWRLENHQGARGTVERVAGGPPEVSGPVLRLRVAKTGADWHVQFAQAGLDLRDGETYTLTFWSRADRKRAVYVSTSLDEEDWHNTGLRSKQTLDTAWRRIELAFTATHTHKKHNRLVFGCGDTEGVVELAGLSLRRGAPEALPKGASLKDGTVPSSRPADSPNGHDWIAFLLDVEARYMDTMRDYVKLELGAKANVVGSQANYGGIGGALREWRSDYTDMHNYWEHPQFPRRDWDAADWRIDNRPMSRDGRGGALIGLARYRLAGKPFVVSEYNHPAPNDYQAECMPMLAAYAGFQDWDGLYLFDYHDAADKWDEQRIRGFFAINGNPAKMALLPAAALSFLRGDVPPASEESRLEIPETKVVEQLARQGWDIGPAWNKTGGVWPEALHRRVSVAFVPDKNAAIRLAPRQFKAEVKPAIQWTDTGTDRALFTADSQRSKMAVGLLGGQTVELSGWTVQHSGKAGTFAAVTLSAKDEQSIERSESLLLTAVGRVENTGTKWNADRNSVGRQWGEAPTLAEGVPATVTIRTQARMASVYALDGKGKRKKRVDSRLADGILRFKIGPEFKTLWYEIEAEK